MCLALRYCKHLETSEGGDAMNANTTTKNQGLGQAFPAPARAFFGAFPSWMDLEGHLWVLRFSGPQGHPIAGEHPPHVQKKLNVFQQQEPEVTPGTQAPHVPSSDEGHQALEELNPPLQKQKAEPTKE